jgi:hypothetical protein
VLLSVALDFQKNPPMLDGLTKMLTERHLYVAALTWANICSHSMSAETLSSAQARIRLLQSIEVNLRRLSSTSGLTLFSCEHIIKELQQSLLHLTIGHRTGAHLLDLSTADKTVIAFIKKAAPRSLATPRATIEFLPETTPAPTVYEEKLEDVEVRQPSCLPCFNTTVLKAQMVSPYHEKPNDHYTDKEAEEAINVAGEACLKHPSFLLCRYFTILQLTNYFNAFITTPNSDLLNKACEEVQVSKEQARVLEDIRREQNHRINKASEVLSLDTFFTDFNGLLSADRLHQQMIYTSVLV